MHLCPSECVSLSAQRADPLDVGGVAEGVNVPLADGAAS
jgi:hypothetical protein